MVAEPPFCSDTGWACEPVWEATGNEAIARVIGWLSEKPLQIAGILALAYLANRVLRSMIARAGRRMAENADRLGGYMPDGLRTREVDGRAVARAATMSTIARSMATAVVAVVAAAWILAVVGVSLAAIVASAGVLGVALGFGAQNLVRDVLAGWFILVEDRYGVGDTIDAGAPERRRSAPSSGSRCDRRGCATSTGRSGTSPTARSSGWATRARAGRGRSSTWR